MTKKSKMTRIYFSHDQDTRNDSKIMKMFFEFRKLTKKLNKEELEALAGISCYAIFWSIIEYLHRNNSFLEEDIELFADELRINAKFVKNVLTEYNLFNFADGEFSSERVSQNIALQEAKSKKAKKAIETRWLISLYDNLYKKEFGITPVLTDKEIAKLIEYYERIEDFKHILPDILYTLKFVHFDGKTKFEPKSNWLLTDNNLARVYHGEFGTLKHKQTDEEKLDEELKKGTDIPSEFDIALQRVSRKAEAIEFIFKNTKKSKSGRLFIMPQLKNLMKKFDISQKELEEKFL